MQRNPETITKQLVVKRVPRQTRYRSEVGGKTATKSPDNPLSFPEKQIDFGQKTPKLYGREYGTFGARYASGRNPEARSYIK